MNPGVHSNWVFGYQMDVQWTVRPFHLVMQECSAHEKGPQGYSVQT